MNKEKLEKKHNSICESITNKKLKEGLDALLGLINTLETSGFITQYQQYNETYKYMLKYTISGVKDPQRQHIYDNLLVSVLNLADKVKAQILMNSSEIPTSQIKQQYNSAIRLSTTEAIKKINDLSNNPHPEWIEAIRTTNIDNIKTKHRSEIVQKLFNRLWLTDEYKGDEVQLMEKIKESKDFVWYEKCLMITAVTLSLFRCFDNKKVQILIDFYALKEKEIWHRALVGLVIALYKYSSRIHLYNDIKDRLTILKDDLKLEKYIETILTQFIKAKDTEKISKKLREEIIPEVMKMAPKLTDKLDLENIIHDDLSDEKNPEWETVFEDTPNLFKKMEELSKMQMEGADIFMSTFAMLKHFDFFDQLEHWLIPFYKTNSNLLNDLADEENNFKVKDFVDAVCMNPFLCNSDKYSFCLNVTQLPAGQKNMMTGMVNAEMESMHELKHEDKMLNKGEDDRYIFTQYIQDLYRFFKLHPLKNIFTDIFEYDIDILESDFLKLLIDDDTKIMQNIGEFYFEKDYYEKTSKIYSLLNEKGVHNYETYQKLAYCKQKLGDYKGALEFYSKAELYDKNKIWNTNKIALCYLRLKEPEKALEQYLKIEKNDPDNLQIQVNIGRCYLDMKDFEQALKYYFKVEYLEPSNKKVMRPISWCCFALGKFDNSKKYLTKIVEIEGNKHDFITLGHVEFCSGNLQNAVDNYIKSIKKEGNNYDLFLEEFNDDKEYLFKHDIDKADIPFILDHIKYTLNP